MRKITFKKLMEKVDEGYAEVNAWASERCGYADVTFYRNASDRGRRMNVEVTNIPEDFFAEK